MVAGREGLDMAGGGGGEGGRVGSGLVNIGCIGWSSLSPSEVRSCRMESQPSDLGNMVRGGPVHTKCLWPVAMQHR